MTTYPLSIAGFDPCGGAGVLADCKVFNAHEQIGFSVSTSITYQHESEFDGVDWLSAEQIINQLKPLFRKYNIEFVKIGLIKDFKTLSTVIEFLKEENPSIYIIWDPILKASAGFNFHSDIQQKEFEKICHDLYLITPNWQEIKTLYPSLKPEAAAEHLSSYCAVLLKGGHHPSAHLKGTDYLYRYAKKKAYPTSKVIKCEKHGSGCVLSSAIVSQLCLGNNLEDSIEHAKTYITNYLDSSENLLGIHKVI